MKGDGHRASGAFHRPVMPAEVLEALAPAAGKAFVDATIGGGGHAALILSATAPDGVLLGIDRDPAALAAAAEALAWAGPRARLVRGRMGELPRIMDAAGIAVASGILADLGVSSHQLDAPSRGMSFRSDAPLDMRMDPDAGETAAELIARLDEPALAQLLWDYGEERASRRIARALAQRRIETTGALAEAVIAALPAAARRGRIHPATRVFQALRIAVNDELGELARFLEAAPQRLAAGGRLVVISYHSLEDRLVKRAFRSLAGAEGWTLPHRKALRPKAQEVAGNPRARSAKLRTIERATM
jgi:16S rRNA (cytosine1402-N4)-methyltransferase